MSFEDDLKATYEAPKPFGDVDVVLNGNPYTLRFTQMDAATWADLCDRSPIRKGVLLDARYGYNLRDLVPEVALLTGGRLDGDTVVPLTKDQWAAILKSNGRNVSRIGDVVFDLNEYTPEMEVENAKKARAVESAKN